MGVALMVRSPLTVQEQQEIWREYGAGASLRSIKHARRERALGSLQRRT